MTAPVAAPPKLPAPPQLGPSQSADPGGVEPSGRLHALDGLRAVAVTLVFAHHLVVAGIAAPEGARLAAQCVALLKSFTASGVELFFVLSAIVLLRPYLGGVAEFDARRYFFRRAQRLFPPYWAAWLLSGFAICLASAFPTWWTAGARLPAFSLSAWLQQAGILYSGSESFNFAWWSLTVEVMFYLLVPILLPLMVWARRDDGRLAGLALAAGGLALAAHGWAFEQRLPFAGALRELGSYAVCFYAGLVLAARAVSVNAGRLAMAAGGVWVVLANIWPAANVHVGWGLVYFGLAALALAGGRGWLEVLSSRPMVWLGERSYSLFLTHYAVIVLVCLAVSWVVPGKGLSYFALTRLLALPLCLLAAMVVFSAVERRFARKLSTAGEFWPPLRAPLR